MASRCVARAVVDASHETSGLTLIAVMIARVILAGGLLTMARVQIQSMKGAQSGRHLAQATAIASSQLEQLERTRWTNIPVTGWTAPTPVNNTVQGAGPQTERAYALSWRITTLTPGKTRALDVRVSWQEPSGRNRSVVLSSVRNNYEGL